MNNFLKILSQRKSCRSFQQRCLNRDELEAILFAGIQAPSAMNRQLCEVYAVTHNQIIDALADAIKEIFIERGENISEHYHCAYHAPVLVIVAGSKDDPCRIEDGSCILENIFLAATSLNIGSCWINQLKDTQNTSKVRHILTNIGIPVDDQVIGCAALGYIQDEGQEKEKLQNRIHII